jgi:hypothetical protein
MPQLPKFQRVPGIIMPKRTPKKRNKVLLVAFIFLLILSISLFLGYNKRQKLELSRQRQQLITDVQYRLEQAESLKNLNPSRAKTLLKEAKTTLEGYHQDESDVDINSLQQKVDHAYGLISRQYFIHEPSVFYNLSLIKDGFKASQVSLSENYLTLVDFSTRTLIRLDINKKSAEIVAGADLVPPSGRLASIPAWIFLELKREFQIIDPQQKEQVTSFKLEKVTIDQLIGYGNNAYVLDKNLGQIWRFRGVQSGLAEPDGFFSDPQDLTYVSQIAIDGSIWFLRLDGGIEKYTTGIKDAYYPEVSMDTPLNSPTQFYTDENLDNLYFLDPQNRRVVEVSKRGQYQSQYIWEEIDSDYQLVVSSSLSKVLLISGDKIYEIDLQKVEHENN